MSQDFTPGSGSNHPLPAYAATLVRQGGAFLAGWLVSNGWLSAEQSPEVIGAVMAVSTLAWGLFDRYSRQKKLNAAIAAPAGQAAL